MKQNKQHEYHLRVWQDWLPNGGVLSTGGDGGDGFKSVERCPDSLSCILYPAQCIVCQLYLNKAVKAEELDHEQPGLRNPLQPPGSHTQGRILQILTLAFSGTPVTCPCVRHK